VDDLRSGDWYADPRFLDAPRHVVSAAVTVVNHRNEILLVKSPRRGWEIPGGQVELGESLRDAAVRETEEESGVVVEITAFCGIFQTIGRSICNALFAGRPIGGELRTSAESIEVGWYALPAALDKVTHPTFRSRIEMSLDASRWPFLVEYRE
jgi:ADP-ribose pyrophosphatase YjhB (NUDIX family)